MFSKFFAAGIKLRPVTVTIRTFHGSEPRTAVAIVFQYNAVSVTNAEESKLESKMYY